MLNRLEKEARYAEKLYKSRTDKVIDGVCGGIAEYFGLDVTLVRLGWVVFTFAGGAGILGYIIAMIIVPVKPAGIEPDETHTGEDEVKKNSNNKLIFGIILITAGFFLLAKDTFLFSLNKYVWPVLFIVGGGYLILKERNGSENG